MFKFKLLTVSMVGVMILLCGGNVNASLIQTADIVAIPDGVVGSGNGNLDLRMFTFSGSEVQNTAGSFNGDNGNTTLPQGGGADIDLFAESYVTTAGELESYYDLKYLPGSNPRACCQMVSRHSAVTGMGFPLFTEYFGIPCHCVSPLMPHSSVCQSERRLMFSSLSHRVFNSSRNLLILDTYSSWSSKSRPTVFQSY